MPPLIFFKNAEVIDSSRDGRKPPTNTCLLPYTGVGSSLTRVRELDDEIELLNDENRQEVIVTFWRKGNQENGKVTKKSNQEDMRTAKEIMERYRQTRMSESNQPPEYECKDTEDQIRDAKD